MRIDLDSGCGKEREREVIYEDMQFPLWRLYLAPEMRCTHSRVCESPYPGPTAPKPAFSKVSQSQRAFWRFMQRINVGTALQKLSEWAETFQLWLKHVKFSMGLLQYVTFPAIKVQQFK